MSAVNQFNGIGGTPGFNNWPNLTQPYAATPTKPLYDPSKANGDCLKQVNGAQSAVQYAQRQMNPNSRDVVFDSNEDIFYIVTSDASGSATVQAFSFAPYKPAEQEQPKYVTMEEFNRFKEEIQNGKQFIRKGNSRNGKPGGKQSADDTE